jgi:hypothetical protein
MCRQRPYAEAGNLGDQGARLLFKRDVFRKAVPPFRDHDLPGSGAHVLDQLPRIGRRLVEIAHSDREIPQRPGIGQLDRLIPMALAAQRAVVSGMMPTPTLLSTRRHTASYLRSRNGPP